MIPCRVVLVRPQIPANLGAVARVMRNMGLSELVLVAPAADPHDREARRLSTHGESILDACRVVSDLESALADRVLAAATSAKTGGVVRRTSAGLPEEVMPRLVEAMAAGPAALVFGPEQSGLTTAEVSRCTHLVHVPTDPTYPALNLAQAVAVCLYELRRAWLCRTEDAEPRERAMVAEQERMFGQLRSALERIHFLYDDRADALMHALRHLIGRAGPTPGEVRVLLGLARQIVWFAEHGRPPGPGP